MEKEFENILQEHNAIIYKVARAYSYYEYKDLYQEILMQLWRSFDRFEGKSKVSTWIYRVALNTAITYKNRRSQNHLDLEKVPELKDESEKSESGAHKIKIAILYKCINQLKPDDRALIILQLEGYDYEEISEIIGITKNLVGVKLNRIKYRIQTLFKKYNYGKLEH